MESILTPREKEVINLLLENPDCKYIAKKLFIAPTTVKTHINNISAKLHIYGSDLKAKIIIKVMKGAVGEF